MLLHFHSQSLIPRPPPPPSSPSPNSLSFTPLHPNSHSELIPFPDARYDHSIISDNFFSIFDHLRYCLVQASKLARCEIYRQDKRGRSEWVCVYGCMELMTQCFGRSRIPSLAATMATIQPIYTLYKTISTPPYRI